MIALLIVDDEFALVDTLKDYLEDAGYQIAIASDGREGLEAMKERVPDLVLTDLMMPLMNGREMVRAMRADPRLASVPVILMSAARRQIAAPPDEDFPTFSAFLRKPFLLAALMEEIVRLVGRSNVVVGK